MCQAWPQDTHSGDDMQHSKPTYPFLAIIAMVCLMPHMPLAGVGELPVTADYCAIEYALTGKSREGCPGLTADIYGIPRSIPAQSKFPRGAAGLRSMSNVSTLWTDLRI